MTLQNNAPHEQYMRRCIQLSRRALAARDAPVGTLVVLNDRIVGEGTECVKARRDVTGHAEIEAVRAACERLGSLDLTGCTLYTNVEPCVMCAYAIRLARVSVVVTGARPAETALLVTPLYASICHVEMLSVRRLPEKSQSPIARCASMTSGSAATASAMLRALRSS